MPPAGKGSLSLDERRENKNRRQQREQRRKTASIFSALSVASCSNLFENPIKLIVLDPEFSGIH
jgi:hypothetical protein